MIRMVEKSKWYMDTVVHMRVETEASRSEEAEAAMNRAFAAFRNVERACSRFDPGSELSIACRSAETPVPLSPLLFEPLKFALEIAEWTGGAFDPSIGGVMINNGFNRHYLTGETMASPSADSVTYRDIALNEATRTMRLRKPLVIDLGAVAKGFAIDLAANELKPFERFLVNAGGDLFAGGADEKNNVWDIGIQHPELGEQTICTVPISNEAICTSGSYERRSAGTTGLHHLICPETGQSPNDWISCSVIAPFAMMADAFSTASFVLGRDSGRTMIEQADLRAILITPGLRIVKVGGI